MTMSFTDALPTINATLNAASAVWIVFGYRAIKTKNIPLHRFAMQAAFVTSTVFLACYLTRVYLTGTHRYPGDGWARTLYLAILFSHTILAITTVPMVLRSLFLARRTRFAEHRKIARFALPVWLYVSVTGVVVYAMLYHLA
jgi:putative membrane protein